MQRNDGDNKEGEQSVPVLRAESATISQGVVSVEESTIHAAKLVFADDRSLFRASVDLPEDRARQLRDELDAMLDG
jgi:hypothetical protein